MPEILWCLHGYMMLKRQMNIRIAMFRYDWIYTIWCKINAQINKNNYLPRAYIVLSLMVQISLND